MKNKKIKSPLSENIDLLGKLLGNVIKEQTSKKTFNLIEAIRKEAKSVRKNKFKNSLQKIKYLVSNLPLEEINNLLKAFTIYFHLVNESEKIEIIRINREREFTVQIKPRKESIKEAVYCLHKNNISSKQLQQILNGLKIEPVFTAHPTEAKRNEILSKLNRISTLLEKKQMLHLLPESEKEKIIKELKNQIFLLWETPEIRYEAPTVLEEAQNNLYYLSETVFNLIPSFYYDLKNALEKYYPNNNFSIPTFIKFGSWVGGDRDGNPNVTSEITKKIVFLNSVELIKKYLIGIKNLSEELTLTKSSKKLIASIKQDEKLFKETNCIYPNEPYKKKLYFIEKKLEGLINYLKNEFRQTSKIKYISTDEFLNDVSCIIESLKTSGFNEIVQNSSINDLLIQVQTFGFHFAEVDIREHSSKHENLIDELLKKNTKVKSYLSLNENEKIKLLSSLINKKVKLKNLNLTKENKTTLNTFKTIKEIQDNLSPEAIRCYIVSFTHSASNILEILFLKEHFNLNLDIVPLFETVKDLKNSSNTLNELLKNKAYKKHLSKRKNFQEIMLGFSDSGKDGGYLAANIELYKSQKFLSDICKKHKISWRFFHGRGGSIGRGGAQSGKAILSEPMGSINGKIRFTEQGEVLSFRYSIPSLTHRHLEAIVSSVLIASDKKEKDLFFNRDYEILWKLEELSRKKYRSLIYENKNFWSYFSTCTPYNFISLLNIASRPTSRSNKQAVEDIRAITWGFSLTQVRLMLNSWFGLGSALYEYSNLTKLKKLYRYNPFFKITIDNCQQAIAKADMKTAEQYLLLGKENTNEVFNIIKKEYDLTCNMILKITEQKEIMENKPVIKKSIALRNPYTDPLNCLQIELIKKYKVQKNNKNITPLILLSINGIAAAMQETG